MKDIEVLYISGFPKEEFEILKELDGLDINIPNNQNNINALALEPDAYIVIFSLFFASKVIEKLFDKVSEKLADKIISIILRLWKKAKTIKPCLIQVNSDPIYKEPKVVILFKISDEETSKLEITNKMDDKEIKSSIKTFLKLIELQYKNRKKELVLKNRLKNQ